MSFLFKNYSLVKVIYIYLLIRCYKTRFFQWNTNNADRNGVNKQNTHTHTRTKHSEKDNTGKGDLVWKKWDYGVMTLTPWWYPLFLKQAHLFTKSLHFYEKNLNPCPVFLKILKTHPSSPFLKGRGGVNYALAFFKLRK